MLKPTYQRENVTLYQGDCMEILLKILPRSGLIDCVITDPPYGIRADTKQAARANKQGGKALAPSKDYGISNWDNQPPEKKLIDFILNNSINQVIFGGNYFDLPVSTGWIVWDKCNGNNTYADCELAWTSYKRAIRKIVHRWHGMLQEDMKNKENRVHPTQKPVPVMAWILTNYTQPSDLILDPFMGSGTTGVACIKTNRSFIGIELGPDYFQIAVERIETAFEQAKQMEFDDWPLKLP